jgi:hypothetical protein
MNLGREERGTAPWPLAGLLLLIGFLCLVGPAAADAKGPLFVDRPTEPVVMTGTDLPRLLGTAPDTVAAYRYQPAKHRKKKGHKRAVSAKRHRGKRHRVKRGRWIQVPVQVDERAVVDFGAVPSGGPPTGDRTVYGTAPVGSTALQYTDPNTFVGPDPDPTLDPDDQVALMASDTGSRAPGKAKRPRIATGAGATRVVVQDPLTAAKGWMYLFRTKSGPAPQPADYVSYDFHLLSGDYKGTYHRNAGPNPEASTISTQGYTAGFSDRWFFDRLGISSGGASGADILDGYKFGFVPGSCGRSEATFNAGEGAFVVNKDGPVRAIRSYVGANSGPYTERTDLFYADRHDIVTDLRVHPIPSLSAQYDMSAAAIGMTYYDEQHQGGVPVDGNPDTLPGTTPSLWHLWQGQQGSLFVDDQVESSFATAFLANATAFYMDDSSPPVSQCWGDSQQIGSAGLSSTAGSGIPATYPGAPDYLHAVSTNLMLPQGQVPSRAALLHQALLHHLLALAGRYASPRPRR